MDPTTIERWAAYAKQHPYTTAVVAGVLFGAVGVVLALLAIGLVAGLFDDKQFESKRVAALIRIGQKVGVVLQGCGSDLVIFVTGDDHLLKSGKKGKSTDSDPPPSD